MTLLPLFKPDYYLIDTSSIMAFSGADWSNPDRFLIYRDKIWSHLENMISSGKLRTVPQVWTELEYNDRPSWERLLSLHGKFVIQNDDDADSMVLGLIWKYGRKLVFSGSSNYTRPPADPYLIAHAKKFSVKIITDEIPLSQRKGKWKSRKISIQDVCEAEGMKDRCICLEELLKSEGVIS